MSTDKKDIRATDAARLFRRGFGQVFLAQLIDQSAIISNRIPQFVREHQ